MAEITIDSIAYQNDQKCIIDQAKRIRELERELAIYRLVGKPKVNVPPAIPEHIEKKFKDFSHGCGEKTMRDISLAMRRICFPPFDKPHYHSYRDGKPSELIKYTYALPINEMTSEQYARYVKILEKLADVLAEYEYLPGEATL